MKSKYSLLRGLCFCLVTFGQYSLASAESALKEGDYSVYRASERDFVGSTSNPLDGDFKVLFSGGKLKVFYMSDGTEVTGVPAAILKRFFAVEQDEQQYLSLPLKVGKSWSTNYTVKLRGAKNPNYISATTTVEKVEEISTEAGSFTVFKINREESWGRGSAKSTLYYNERLGRVVKYSYQSVGNREVELIGFGKQSDITTSN